MYIVIALYGAAMLFLLSFSLVQLSLTLRYLKSGKAGERKSRGVNSFPFVTVQLPIYNERFVVERLLRSTAKMNYPKDRWEIQLLDDSDDQTSEIASRIVQELKRDGIVVEHIRRTERSGYKAGALQYGLEQARGEFIAIFDADFVPNPEFLQRSLQSFDSDTACVQTRWAHLNREQNTLTKAQALALDAHFSIEQVGRNRAGHFINFNGTAGIWRKEAILDAGGWKSDTLTEDLDLSYRIQLKGWKMTYREDLDSPAELPMTLGALRTQQHRWNKGAAECARKHLPELLASKTPLRSKVHAFFHLMNSGVFLSVLLLTILSVPLLYIQVETKFLNPVYASFFLISFVLLGLFFWIPFKRRMGGGMGQFMQQYFQFIAISMSFALFNSIAVLEGYFGKKSAFIRTPKFNALSAEQNPYFSFGLGRMFYFELALLLYFGFGIAYALYTTEWGLLPLHLLMVSGLGVLAFWSWKERARPTA